MKLLTLGLLAVLITMVTAWALVAVKSGATSMTLKVWGKMIGTMLVTLICVVITQIIIAIVQHS